MSSSMHLIGSQSLCGWLGWTSAAIRLRATSEDSGGAGDEGGTGGEGNGGGGDGAGGDGDSEGGGGRGGHDATT